MSNRFASGQKALALCDVCGFPYKLRELRNNIVKGVDTHVKACPECWDPDQPQLHLGEFPVDDPQALRDPRPDFNEFPQERARLQPSGSVYAGGTIGYVKIVIS
jgi:hypothetical protein